MALAVVLLSDQIRGKARQFVERNFRRPRHDYRKQWMAFTKGTSGVLDVHAYCAAVARAVAETFGTSSVTLWLLDAGGQRVVPGGSTEFSQAQARQLVADESEAGYLVRVVVPASIWAPATTASPSATSPTPQPSPTPRPSPADPPTTPSPSPGPPSPPPWRSISPPPPTSSPSPTSPTLAPSATFRP